jgi:hypothetical protein
MGEQYSRMWSSGGRAVQLHVENWWDSSMVTYGEILGQHLPSYMWRSGGKAV